MVNNSNGSTVSHYALSTQLEESFFEQRVEKAIQLAPCTTLVNFEYFTGGIPITAEHVAMLYDTGFTHFGGELLSPFMTSIKKFCSSRFGKYLQEKCDRLLAASDMQPVSLKLVMQYL